MMFHPLDLDSSELTSLEARAHVVKLEAERSLALRSRLGACDAYMSDLNRELALSRQVYEVLAVTDIASLRAELFGAQTG